MKEIYENSKKADYPACQRGKYKKRNGVKKDKRTPRGEGHG